MSNFTPVLKGTQERLCLDVSPDDIAALKHHYGRAGVFLGAVTDITTARKFNIHSKSCGLDCCCDAWAKEVSGGS